MHLCITLPPLEVCFVLVSPFAGETMYYYQSIHQKEFLIKTGFDLCSISFRLFIHLY